MAAVDVAQSLGFLIDGRRGIVTPLPQRLERVILCFKWLSRRPRVSAKTAQKLLGHAVHFMMLRRDIVSVLRGLYDLVQRVGSGRHRLWSTAAREAKWLSRLLRACSADMTRPWLERVTGSGASLSGIAVCARSASSAKVESIGRVRESWRFKGVSPENRPRTVLHSRGDPFGDPDTAKNMFVERWDPFELNENFHELQQEFLDPGEWHQFFAQHMQYP